MIDPTTILRVGSILCWGALFFYMLPGACSAIWAKRTRRGDPMRLGVALTALLFVGYGFRAVFAHDNVISLWLLHCCSMMVAVYIGWLGETYGRGPRV